MMMMMMMLLLLLLLLLLMFFIVVAVVVAAAIVAATATVVVDNRELRAVEMLTSAFPHLICALGGTATERNNRCSCGHIGEGVEHNVMLVVDVAALRCRAVGNVASDDAHIQILMSGERGEGRCTCGCGRGVASCATSTAKDSERRADERVGEKVSQ